ncbi:rho GTPase-activating protein 20-like isoform X2 [Chrysoperla carnea]|uniref:rho GTPase-activating protein 20-like isoform X2 n=1 Tax=Chrysoperla carnea TaxID=189513 RepID=UPI001D077D7D|nr:rho GTPase-activating protein 20-like isoform X2 [Chrysoperla carnea]
MFENLITRITSPNSRRRYIYNCQPINNSVNSNSEAHSEPELDEDDNMHDVSAQRKLASRPSRNVIERRRIRGKKVIEPGLRQARSLGRLDGLREAERLADYSRSLSGSQPTLADPRSRDLDRIQQLFPQDFLGLHEPDPSDGTKYGLYRGQQRSALTRTYSAITPTPPAPRCFLMEAPCALGTPGNPHSARPRHLFLFSDVLLIGKARNGLTYKLKDTIRVSELWLAASPDHDTGFLLGWPGKDTTPRTYLVVWATHAAKDLWWSALQNALANRLPLEPAFTSVRVIWKDPNTNEECHKTLSISPELTSAALTRLALPRTLADSGTYTMYCRCRTDNSGTATPLNGYERPHAIQLARIRQDVSADEGFDLAHCISSPNASSAVIFELRQNCKTLPKKTPLKLFRKGNARLWGVSLNRICTNGVLPPTIIAILRGLMLRGPHTHGIFRRCASVRSVRELREKIDRGGAAICEELLCTSALLLAALLKDFLRNLPEPIIVGDIIQWVKSATKIDRLRLLIQNLPRENNSLLAHIICVLYHVAKRSEHNQMNAKNLGVCVGPSIMWGDTNPIKESALIVENLITHCRQIFGPHVISLLGEPTPDSGAEESDSLHSLVDSVELSRDQKSLSRDSGLTLSEDDRDSPGLAWATTSAHISSSSPYHLPHQTNHHHLTRLNQQSQQHNGLLMEHRQSSPTLNLNDIEIHHATLLTPPKFNQIQLNLSISPPPSSYSFQRGGWWRQAARASDLPNRPPAPLYRQPPPVCHSKSTECILIDESESYV